MGRRSRQLPGSHHGKGEHGDNRCAAGRAEGSTADAARRRARVRVARRRRLAARAPESRPPRCHRAAVVHRTQARRRSATATPLASAPRGRDTHDRPLWIRGQQSRRLGSAVERRPAGRLVARPRPRRAAEHGVSGTKRSFSIGTRPASAASSTSPSANATARAPGAGTSPRHSAGLESATTATSPSSGATT